MQEFIQFSLSPFNNYKVLALLDTHQDILIDPFYIRILTIIKLQLLKKHSLKFERKHICFNEVMFFKIITLIVLKNYSSDNFSWFYIKKEGTRMSKNFLEHF